MKSLPTPQEPLLFLWKYEKRLREELLPGRLKCWVFFDTYLIIHVGHIFMEPFLCARQMCSYFELFVMQCEQKFVYEYWSFSE